MPNGLRRLDDKVLGDRGRRSAEPADDAPASERTEAVRTTREPAERTGGGDGLRSFLAVLWRVSRLVLLALAAVVLLAAALVLLPANEDNVIVRNVLSLGETVAGPFRDVFTLDDPDRMRVVNYGLAAVVYAVLASVVGKLPTGGRKS